MYYFSPYSVHVVFGRVLSGQDIVRDVENQKVNSNHKPYADVRVTHCGELVKKSKVETTAKDTKKKKKSELFETANNTV